MRYVANETRYDNMPYERCGNSGLKLPKISLGLWHNFGHEDTYENMAKMLTTAFDLGITHFDLANNYGSDHRAEENFGYALKHELRDYRDEMIISTKAGHYDWPGPYGDWGSRKYLMASLDRSLKAMGLDYVDIFYSHRFDPETPLEETMWALGDIVKQGKALYIGISKYPADAIKKCVELGREMRVPVLIHQASVSMLNRSIIENGALDATNEAGVGTIAFSPLAQGILTDKYLNGTPADSRLAKPHGFLKEIKPETLDKVRDLSKIAEERGQTMAQMALSWVLNLKGMTSCIIGASKVEQILDSVKAKDNTEFSAEELKKIDSILNR